MDEDRRTFSGRPLVAGRVTAPAVVSPVGFNTLASFRRDVMMGKRSIRCADEHNPDLLGQVLTGRALCLPRTIGSTSGGMVLQTVIDRGVAPAALLFGETIDSLAGAGVILARVWDDHRLVTVDRLGDGFLQAVHTGDTVTVEEDGTVIIR